MGYLVWLLLLLLLLLHVVFVLTRNKLATIRLRKTKRYQENTISNEATFFSHSQGMLDYDDTLSSLIKKYIYREVGMF